MELFDSSDSADDDIFGEWNAISNLNRQDFDKNDVITVLSSDEESIC